MALGGVSVGSTGVQLETNAAIIDSGTTGIIASSDDAQAINGVRRCSPPVATMHTDASRLPVSHHPHLAAAAVLNSPVYFASCCVGSSASTVHAGLLISITQMVAATAASVGPDAGRESRGMDRGLQPGAISAYPHLPAGGGLLQNTGCHLDPAGAPASVALLCLL